MHIDVESAFAGVRPKSGKLRVGLIGAGGISPQHLAAWGREREAEVVAICDRDRSRAEARASEFGVGAAYEDAREMFVCEALDAVDIATWRETHAELVMLAASHGVHALCQKPLTPTFAQAQSLARSVDGKIRLMVNENRRFAPQFRAIRAWIDEGKVGRIRQCIATTSRSSLIVGSDGRRLEPERAAFHARERRLLIGEALIHQLDVLRFLVGPMRVVAARVLRTEPDLPGETVATLLLETVPDGAPVVVAGSYVSPGFENRKSDRFELAGNQSTVLLSDNALELRGRFSERLAVDEASAYRQCFDDAVAHFVERLLSGLPFETELADNLETLRLMEDAYALAGEPSVP